jgi:hypothetical protein
MSLNMPCTSRMAGRLSASCTLDVVCCVPAEPGLCGALEPPAPLQKVKEGGGGGGDAEERMTVL